MYIVLATNTNGTQRAFIKKSVKSADSLIKQLLEGGWLKARKTEVDRIMFDTLQIKLN